MRVSVLAKAAPVAVVLALSALLIVNKGQSHVQATLFSPTMAEQGITVSANTDSVILCTGHDAYPVTTGALSTDTSIRFWVYEYTGDEPPNDGAYYASSAQKQIDPAMAQAPQLTKMTRGKMYRVNTDHDVHFQCGVGFSEIGSSTQQVSSSNASLPQLNNPGNGGTTGGDATQPCTQQECGPPLGMPNSICADGSIAGPVCTRDSSGRCGYTIKQCPSTKDGNNANNPPLGGGPNGGAPQCQTITCTYTLAPGCQYVPGVSQNGCPVCGNVSCNASQTGGNTAGTSGGVTGGTTGTNGGTFSGTNGGGGNQCVPADCAAPPQGCHYENPVVQNGCPLTCGQLVCSQNQFGGTTGGTTGGNGGTNGGPGGSQCVPVDCAAPPPHCHYANPTYQNGCLTSCGTPVCDQTNNNNDNTNGNGDNGGNQSSSVVPVVLVTSITNEPSYGSVRAGSTISFDVTLSDQQGTTDTAYVGLFPFGPGSGGDQTLSFSAVQSDARCRAMRNGPDSNGIYDPIWTPYDIHSAAVYCAIGTMAAGQTETLHITYQVEQDIAPVCDPAGSPADAGLQTSVQAGSNETHASASAQLGPVPTCAPQTNNTSDTSSPSQSCTLPNEYVANASMYGVRFNRQRTDDNTLFAYTVKVNNPQGVTTDVYTSDLKLFNKTTCQETTLDTTVQCTGYSGGICVGTAPQLALGFDEPSISNDGKILENAYQLDAPTHTERIYHSLYILDSSGHKIATIAQQIPVGTLQLNGSSWPLTKYSNTDAEISKDGSKVVFEAFTPNGSLDTASGQPWLLPYGNQVYVWQNGKITQITRYNGNPNISQNHPWNWDARFEDDAGRFISINLGYDPQTGQMFPAYQPGGPGTFWMPVYKLYLYDSATQTFYKISDDVNPQPREQYQSQINAEIVSLGGTVSQPPNPPPDGGQPQGGTTGGQTTGGTSGGTSGGGTGISCTSDNDCPATQCTPCNAKMQSCSVCLSYSCQAGTCVKKIVTTF